MRTIGRLVVTVVSMAVFCIIIPLFVGASKLLVEKQLTFQQFFNDPLAALWQPKLHFQNFFIWDPMTAAGGFILIILFLGCLRYVYAGRFKEEKSFESRAEYGSHGSARWQNDQDKKKYYKSAEGIVIGDVKERVYVPKKKYAIIPNNGEQNLNMIIFGPPGSEKTTGIVLPNILHNILNPKMQYSMVMTDPKGELYELTSPLLLENGYEVYVLDFLHLKRGNQMNFCDFIFDDTDLMKIAESYVSGSNISKGSKGSSDPIWDQGETSLLAALMGFVMQVYKDKPEKQNYAEIARIVNTEFHDEEEYKFLFKRNGVTGTANHLFNNFLLAKDKVRDGILFGLATKLTLFAIPSVQKLTSKSDFSLEDIGRKKIGLYIMVSDADRTFSPLVTVFWSIFFSAIYKVRLLEKESKQPVLCLMDELANIGRIGGLQEKLGTMRSRHIYPLMIWQSLPQLKDRYPGDAWEDVISMCDTRMLLAANDQATKKYFSEELGTTTVKIQGSSQSMKREELSHSSQSQSSNFTGRPLLFPDEVGRMPKTKIIVMEKGKDPLMLTKLQYRYWEQKYQVCTPVKYIDIPELSLSQEEYIDTGEVPVDKQYAREDVEMVPLSENVDSTQDSEEEFDFSQVL